MVMFAARELLACATQTTAHSTATRVASPQFRFRVNAFTTVLLLRVMAK
jgi:hypothetical protein